MFSIASFASRPFSSYVSKVNIQIFPSGVYSIGYIGSVSATGSANVFPTGIYATGFVGRPIIWSLINNDQNPNWTTIDNSQSPVWTIIPT